MKRSTQHKLVLKNRIVAEGSARAMRKLLKRYPEAFIGSSPGKKIGDIFDSSFPAF